MKKVTKRHTEHIFVRFEKKKQSSGNYWEWKESVGDQEG